MVSGNSTRSQGEFSDRVNIFAFNAVVRHSQAKGSALAFLFALAKWADDDGVCWPSMSTIARALHCSKRQAQDYRDTLVEQGELVSEIRKGDQKSKTNRYTLPCVAKAKQARPVKPAVKPREVPNTRPQKTDFTEIRGPLPTSQTVPTPKPALKNAGEGETVPHTEQAAEPKPPAAPPQSVQPVQTKSDLTDEQRQYYVSILAKIISPEAYRRRIPLNKTQLRALRNRMTTGGLPWPRPGSWLDAQIRRPI